METKKIEIIEVTEPKVNLANIARSTGMLIGLGLIFIGIVMCLTVILLIPGICIALTGVVVTGLSIPKAVVICPDCEYKNKISPPTPSVECERCKTNIPIKWKEEERSKRGFWTRSIFEKE